MVTVTPSYCQCAIDLETLRLVPLPSTPTAAVLRSQPGRTPAFIMAQQQQQQEMSEFMERYQILGQLGKGAFGRVLHAVDRTRRIEVAIKIVELTALPVDRYDVVRAILGRHLITEMKSHYW